MQLEKTFFQKEVRFGYEVSEKVKKIWAVELNLLEYFDNLCREHNLRYFIEYGTLLGAVRHQGFIPWDDDIDVVMFRDDYEKLKIVAQDAVCPPYFFQDAYTDSMVGAFSKLRDSRTTAIEFPDALPDYNQGIFIDIFPLDHVSDGVNMDLTIGEIQREIWMSIVNPQAFVSMIEQGHKPVLDTSLYMELLRMPVRERIRTFEEFNISQFGKSGKVQFITDFLWGHPGLPQEWYSEVIYLPFENLMAPVPAEYDKILKHRFGDYMTPVQGKSDHEGIFWDPDVPYTKYMK